MNQDINYDIYANKLDLFMSSNYRLSKEYPTINEERAAKSAVFIFDKYAADYDQKFQPVVSETPLIIEFISRIPENQLIVADIACGSGILAHYIAQKKSNIKFVCMDGARNMIEIASGKSIPGEFIHSLFPFPNLNEQVHSMICSFLLNYLKSDEIKPLLHYIIDNTNKNGFIYLSLYTSKENLYLKHINEHKETLITYIPERNGFLETLKNSGLKILHQFEKKSDRFEELKELYLILQST
jgi:predicted TPR repeat methyltransferase